MRACLGPFLVRLCSSACSGLNRLDDVVIPGAAAQVAVQFSADLLFVRMWMPAEQINCAHDHTGGAITALQSVVVAKCCLHGMHGAVCLGEAFNGYDRAAVRLHGEHVA